MKTYCDGRCSMCSSQGGENRTVSGGTVVHFCSNCKEIFYCDYSVGSRQTSQGSSVFFCPKCGRDIVQETLYNVNLEIAGSMIGLNPISRPSTISIHKGEISSFSSTELLSEFYSNSEQISTNYLINELEKIQGLTPQVIYKAAKEFGIDAEKLMTIKQTTNAYLRALGDLSPKLVQEMYELLVNMEQTTKGLTLRFLVYSTSLPEIFHLQYNESLPEAGPYDLLGYDKKGRRLWVFTSKIVDSKDIEEIMNPLLVQDQSEFYGVSKILIVAKGFSYVAKKLIKKYPGIHVTNQNTKKETFIPFDLWEETSSRTIDFRRVE